MKSSAILAVIPFAAASVACGGASDKNGTSNVQAAATCGLHTQYEGDDYCILPPDPSEGIQLHVGPTNYDDPAEVAPYLLNPGEENVTDFATTASKSGFYYLKQQNRMRPSSHHMLIFGVNDPTLQPGLVPGGCPMTKVTSFVPGSQVPTRDFPGKMAPEDKGMAYRFNDANMGCFQMHYINTSGDNPVLREGWVNLYFQPDSEVTQDLHPVFMVADLAANHPAGQTSYSNESLPLNMQTDTRLYGVSAHMHAHSTRFKVWRQAAGAAAPGDLIYESFNWHDPLEAGFNSVINNPAIDDANHTDGAVSGQFLMHPGDTINWECQVTNDTNIALPFNNQVNTAEMCMLVGNYISSTPGLMSGTCIGGHCATTFPL